MARTLNRLTDASVKNTTKPKLGDGGGLWLHTKPSGTKSWEFRYKLRGKERTMGLGAYPTVTLARARAKAAQCREQLADGLDPLAIRHQAQANVVRSFGEVSAEYIERNRAGWSNPKHAQQWVNTLATYGEPINALDVAKIIPPLVLQCVDPIWTTKHETASRVRGRIETILDYAIARGYREAPNPAAMKGNLSHMLPKVERKQQHFPALDYRELPAFMAELKGMEGMAARALVFTILTAARTGETLGATWDEISGKVWTIPAERMKAGSEHRVPLSPQALAVLEALPRIGPFIFPGAQAKKGLSNMAMTQVLRRMGRTDITVHGFRSSFRTWTAERTSAPNHVAEQALAHTIPNAVEAAYRRGDLFDKRIKLMATWSQYVTAEPGAIVEIGARE